MSSSSQSLRMVQCVPGWELEEDPAAARLPFNPNSSISYDKTRDDPTTLGYEVAELTYENGQIAMHGLGLPRVMDSKLVSSTWEKPVGNGTLECIVNQAVHVPPCGSPNQIHEELLPWFNRRSVDSSAATAMDALVPSSSGIQFVENGLSKQQYITTCTSGKSTRVESSGGGTATPTATSLEGSKEAGGPSTRKRAHIQPLAVKSRNQSVSVGETLGRESMHVRGDSCDIDVLGSGFTSTSLGLDSNLNTLDTRDSHSDSRPQKQSRTEDQSCQNEKSTLSTKRSRAAAIHNQSERKRRDKINQRMKTLQKLVPTSSKTDKASMLDEVIEYLKTLQAQVQMMSKMSMPHMMMPMTMQQQLQMSMMAQMGMGMGMGMGVGVIDMNSMGRGHIPGMPQVLNPTAFVPMASWNSGNDRLPPGVALPDPAAFLACQAQQPMTMDAYSRMAALYQQLHLQQQASNPKP